MRDRAGGAERTPRGHASRQDPRSRCRRAREAWRQKAPAVRERERSERRSSPAVASPSRRPREASRSRSTARLAAPRSRALSRAMRRTGTLGLIDGGAFSEPSTKASAELLSEWGKDARLSSSRRGGGGAGRAPPTSSASRRRPSSSRSPRSSGRARCSSAKRRSRTCRRARVPRRSRREPSSHEVLLAPWSRRRATR